MPPRGADARIAVALALLVLLLRLPFVAHTLFSWDSVLYARALEQGFHVDADLAGARPHPPGYILYVGIAALVRLVVGDSNGALVAVAAAASAGAVAVTYLLARRAAPRGPALACALGLATAPLFWQHGEIAMPYTVLALLSVTLALLFREARGRTLPAIVAASLAFGVGAGARQDVLLLFTPLWLWMLAPATWRTRWSALAALGAGCLVWFVPSVVLSGGPSAYLGAVLTQSTRVGSTYSVVAGGTDALTSNLALVTYGLGWGVGAFVLVLLVVGGARLVARRRWPEGSPFYAAWLIPPLAVYAVLHIGEPGYVLALLPGIFVVAAALLAGALRPPRAAGVALALAMLDALVFVATGAPYSAATVEGHDRSLGERVAFVRAHYPPSATTLVAQFEYLHARYYLAEYDTLFVGRDADALTREPGPHVVDPAAAPVVAFGLVREVDGRLRAGPLSLPGLALLQADPGVTFTAYDLD